jgi:hypothetical protein
MPISQQLEVQYLVDPRFHPHLQPPCLFSVVVQREASQRRQRRRPLQDQFLVDQHLETLLLPEFLVETFLDRAQALLAVHHLGNRQQCRKAQYSVADHLLERPLVSRLGKEIDI